MIARIQELLHQYGPAFFIVHNSLGFVSFAMIYLALRFLDIDVAWHVRQWRLGSSMEALAESGGLFALTYALNRLTTVVRMLLTVMAMPLLAEPINKLAGPTLEKLGWKLNQDAAAPAEQDDKNKTKNKDE